MKLRTLASIPAVALALAGCGTAGEAATVVTPTPTPAVAASSASMFLVLGTLDLKQAAGEGKVGDSCQGLGGYSDIRQGAQIKISDSTGKIVQLEQLGAGFRKMTNSSLGSPDVCEFAFGSSSVPDTGDSIYGVEVASRGVVNFQKGSPVLLTLGS